MVPAPQWSKVQSAERKEAGALSELKGAHLTGAERSRGGPTGDPS